MGRLEPKHWALIAGFLGSVAVTIAGLDHWADAVKPAFVAGFIGQVSTLLGAIFVGAPQNPNLNYLVNPGRRADDPAPSNAPLGTVSDATRRNL